MQLMSCVKPKPGLSGGKNYSEATL